MRKLSVFTAVAGLIVAAGTTAGMAGAASASPVAPHDAAAKARPGSSAWLKSNNLKRVCRTPKHAGTMACMALEKSNVKPKAHPDAPSGLGPSDIQKAYNLPSGSAGSGQTVAIVDAYDYPNAQKDLNTYRSQYNLPACGSGCFKRVDENGGTSYPKADQDWNVEEALDIDMVSAACPKCHIVLVEANNPNTSDLGKAENTAAKAGKYVSNSWGGAEDSSQTQADKQYFTHPGVALTASSGDNGYGTSWPASSNLVTAVGGTTLKSGKETAWNGAGSGCSSVESKPSWQKDTGCKKKSMADVAAVADPSTGPAIYNSGGGGWQQVGGTSASSPIIASVYALAGKPGDKPASDPYAHTGNLNDVTSGSNGSCNPSYLCTAGKGYDGPTGLGTPNGVKAFTG